MFHGAGQAVRRSWSVHKCFTEKVSQRAFLRMFALFVPFRPFSIRSERSAVAFSWCFAFVLRALLRGLRFKVFICRFLGRLRLSWINTRLLFFRSFMGLFWGLFAFGFRSGRPSVHRGRGAPVPIKRNRPYPLYYLTILQTKFFSL